MKARPAIPASRRPAQSSGRTAPACVDQAAKDLWRSTQASARRRPVSNQLRAAGIEALPSAPPSSAADATRDGERPAIPDTLPILPVRNTVIFPGMIVPLTI